MAVTNTNLLLTATITAVESFLVQALAEQLVQSYVVFWYYDDYDFGRIKGLFTRPI